jgi:hypothetical protein
MKIPLKFPKIAEYSLKIDTPFFKILETPYFYFPEIPEFTKKNRKFLIINS